MNILCRIFGHDETHHVQCSEFGDPCTHAWHWVISICRRGGCSAQREHVEINTGVHFDGTIRCGETATVSAAASRENQGCEKISAEL